jgi:hypothetical protein
MQRSSRFPLLRLRMLAGAALLLGSCQQVLTPAAFLAARPTRRSTVIRMDNTMHLTPSKAVIDSTVLVKRVTDAIMASPGKQLKIVVYYSVGGSWPYRLARAAGYTLEESLIQNGFDKSRIDHDVENYVRADSAKSVPYPKIDFVVSQAKKRLPR